MKKSLLVLLVILSISMISCESNEDRKYGSIFQAIKSNDLQAVKDYVRKNTDIINAEDSENGSPLHLAAYRGHLDIVIFLIEKNADINKKDKEGCTSLHHAVRNNQIEIIKFLISKGADLNATNLDGKTPICEAVHHSNKFKRGALTETAKYLISKGAKVNVRYESGFTPLHYACLRGDLEMVKLFVNNGANINAGSGVRPTPLSFAIRGNSCDKNRKVINFLLKNGAKKSSFQ